MANAAGVISVWAKYGASPPPHQYKLLQQVTHWTPEDVAREEAIETGAAGAELIPNFTLENTFDELLDHFELSETLQMNGRCEKPTGWPVSEASEVDLSV